LNCTNGTYLIAFEATLKGLNKLLLNEPKFHEDLEKNWAVVAEAIQTILRQGRISNPYRSLKGLTRTNEAIDKNAIHGFITTLDVSDEIKAELMQITPSNFLGI
jgi:adenylosuccinate lyase